MTDFLLDTNIVSDLIRNPHGQISSHVRKVGEGRVVTSIVVAAELRYGAKKKASPRLTRQLEAVLGVLPVLPFETPADKFYSRVRRQLETLGKPIGSNDLLIAAHALSLGRTLITDNIREFTRVRGLKVENWLRI